MKSWLVHLRRISPYLSNGEGIWWTQVSTMYQFFDGETNANFHQQGPRLEHYRDMSPKALNNMIQQHWQTILEKITIPTPYIQLYDHQRYPTEKIYFNSACSSKSPLTPQNNPSTPTTSVVTTPSAPTLSMTTPNYTPMPAVVYLESCKDSDGETQGR